MQNQTLPSHTNLSAAKRSSFSSLAKPHTSSSLNPPVNQQSQSWSMVLPTGWKREECLRVNGLGTGKPDVYYISPQGQQIRTKQEMQAILGDKYDVSFFDWRLGKFIMPAPKTKRPDESTDSANNKIARLDTAPCRRTLPFSDIKPVIIRSHPECKRNDVKTTNQDVPLQLFWEKRLANSFAVDPIMSEPLKSMELPKNLQSCGVPGYQSTQLIQSLIYAIASKTIPITGQEQSPSAIEKNPCVALNQSQPMVKNFIVTDDDIRRQEARVKELRKKLAVARRKLHPRFFTEREG